MSQEAQLIALEHIRLDEDVWPREGFDHDRVDDFAELFRAHGADALPPVVIVSDGAGQYLICDGHHRISALYAIGAEVALTLTEDPPGGQTPEQHAFEFAVRTAAHAAKPLTRAERNRAVERMLDDHADWSDRKIADLCGVSHQTVGRHRARRSDGPGEDQRSPDSGSAFRRVGELEAAERLIKALEKVREARGLGVSDFLAGRDRTGDRLAGVLVRAVGASALDRAHEYRTWITAAIDALSEDESRDQGSEDPH